MELLGNARAAARSLSTASQFLDELPEDQCVKSEALFAPLFFVLSLTGVFGPQTFSEPKFPPAPVPVGPALTMYWVPWLSCTYQNECVAPGGAP